MTTRLGPKGQVVIPKRIRDHLGLRPGDTVAVEQDGAAVRISKGATVDDLFDSLPPSDIDPLEELVAERRQDRAREARKFHGRAT